MRTVLTTLALTMLVSACGSSNSVDIATPMPTPPPAAEQESFTSFTKTLLEADANDDPVEINDIDFTFDADDDAEAFDDVLDSM